MFAKAAYLIIQMVDYYFLLFVKMTRENTVTMNVVAGKVNNPIWWARAREAVSGDNGINHLMEHATNYPWYQPPRLLGGWYTLKVKPRAIDTVHSTDQRVLMPARRTFQLGGVVMRLKEHLTTSSHFWMSWGKRLDDDEFEKNIFGDKVVDVTQNLRGVDECLSKIDKRFETQAGMGLFDMTAPSSFRKPKIGLL
jgi:hypothetical protein